MSEEIRSPENYTLDNDLPAVQVSKEFLEEGRLRPLPQTSPTCETKTETTSCAPSPLLLLRRPPRRIEELVPASVSSGTNLPLPVSPWTPSWELESGERSHQEEPLPPLLNLFQPPEEELPPKYSEEWWKSERGGWEHYGWTGSSLISGMLKNHNDEPFVPGNSSVKRGVVTKDGFYCSEHESYIKPLIVRVGDQNYPACEDCFLEELAKSDCKLGDPLDTGEEIMEVGCPACGHSKSLCSCKEEEDELVGEATLEPEDDITEEIVAGI